MFIEAPKTKTLNKNIIEGINIKVSKKVRKELSSLTS